MDVTVGWALGMAFMVVFGGIFLHEGCHYAVARFFTSHARLAFDGPTPNIQYDSLDGVPDVAIRLLGVAPFAIGTGLFVIAAISGWSQYDSYVMVLGAWTAIPSLVSGGDILAVFSPSKFREYSTTVDSETPGPLETMRMIRQ